MSSLVRVDAYPSHWRIGKTTAVHAGTKLTVDVLAALGPNDAVVIESGAEAGRPWHTSGTVARVTSGQVMVQVGSPLVPP